MKTTTGLISNQFMYLINVFQLFCLFSSLYVFSFCMAKTWIRASMIYRVDESIFSSMREMTKDSFHVNWWHPLVPDEAGWLKTSLWWSSKKPEWGLNANTSHTRTKATSSSSPIKKPNSFIAFTYIAAIKLYLCKIIPVNRWFIQHTDFLFTAMSFFEPGTRRTFCHHWNVHILVTPFKPMEFHLLL